MDKKRQLFLTVKISVVLANEQLNIAEITIATLNNENDDSEDE